MSASTPRDASARSVVIALAKRRDPNLSSKVDAGVEPRPEYLVLADVLSARIIDFDDTARSRHPAVRLARRFGGPLWGLAVLVLVATSRPDIIYATGEDVGLPLAMLCRFTRRRGTIVTVAHHMETARRTRLARLLGPGPFRAVITLATVQHDWLVQRVGWPAHLVHRLDYWCDTSFFRPPDPTAAVDEPYVFTCGMEARDYSTLLDAAATTGLPFRIVASGWSAGAGFQAVDVTPPPNVSVESGVPATRLRELYQGAAVVVMALHDSMHPAGITAVVEAMACGKPVIATASPGIADVVGRAVGPSVVGTTVGVGDAAGIVDALRAVWADPDAASAVGTANRTAAEAMLTNEAYARNVAALIG